MAEDKTVCEMDTEMTPESQETQSVMSRVSNLPLVSSACGVVSSVYSSTKESVPLFRGVMDAAESGVRTLGAAASSGTKPLLNTLEPQIAMVNEYAMKGLDKVEEKLPILHQPAEKVVDKVYQSVSGAKEAVLGAVLGGVEMTRSAVSEGFSSVMSSRMGQMVSSGVGLALTRSEDWVEQNLPLTEKELAALAEPLPSEEGGASLSPTPSYFVRLGKLSARVRERALELSLNKVRKSRDATHATVAQLSSTLDLLEAVPLGGATEQLRRRWKEWKEGEHKEEDGPGAEEAEPNEEKAAEPNDEKDHGEQLEWRTLSMVQGLSAQLRVACVSVVSSAQGLPVAVQEQLRKARHTAEELHSSLGTSSSITPLLLQQSRQQITQVRQSLDGVAEYLLNNTPLNWLVGPFSPQVTEKRLSGE